LKELFSQLFISSQVSTPTLSSTPHNLPTARNRAALQEIFIKATRIDTLAMGLAYFLSGPFQEGLGEADLIKWGVEIAKETLRSSVGIM
jgi:nucleolar MIF4G domain-containing protein 1